MTNRQLAARNSPLVVTSVGIGHDRPGFCPMNSERRHFTSEEKIAALKRHLLEGVPISTICDQHGIAP